MKVVFGEEACRDLDEIRAWIAKDRPEAAASVIERILAAAEHLGRLPRTGHKGREPGTFEWLVSGFPYVVVYEPDAIRGQVVIIGVFHKAREHRRE